MARASNYQVNRGVKAVYDEAKHELVSLTP